jgi:hypothetical protein
MATSLLAGIDWTNLSSAELTTAVKVLCQALQERFNIGAMRIDGTYLTSGTVANPSDNTLKNMFPYKTNSPRWPLNDGDPLVNFTDSNLAAQDDLNHLILNAAQHYADIERWNDAATNKDSDTTLFVLSATDTDDPQYPTRLHEVTGYTTYPDLSVMAPEEIKKLYDMVVEMRYVLRNPDPTARSNVHRVFKGEFDTSQSNFYVAEDNVGDGANYYNSGSASGIPIATTGPYSNFKTGNSNLFTTLSTSFDESTDSGTHEPPFYHGIDNPYYIWHRRFTADGLKYTNFIKSFLTYYVVDWATPQTAVGFTGKPVDYKGQNLISNLVETFPTGNDTNFQFPASTTAVNQRYWETLTDTAVGDVVTLKRDNLLVGVTLPATPSTIPNNDSIKVEVTVNSNLCVQYLEDWDGDGGFEYYTPP